MNNIDKAKIIAAINETEIIFINNRQSKKQKTK